MIAPADDWQQRIKRLRLLNVQLLELARADRWDEVIESEEKRRTLLDDLCQQTPPAALAPLLQDVIRATLASDADLLELARAERDKLSGYLKSFGQGRRARRAYQSL